MDYLNMVSKEKKEYFELLEPNFPEWLREYINTPSLLKQQYISVTCGTYYSNLFKNRVFFSSLDHSIAVALICWHYTHDKKVTLSGLFHDVATPVFKHSIDFMNGDYVNQESTEKKTKEIIKNDEKVMKLLERDNILVDEIYDYKIYPIADNDTPRLSSDRFEYSLSNMYFTYGLVDFNTIKLIYQSVTSNFTNEDGIIELGFEDLEQARKFVEITSKLSIIYREDRTIYSMQLLADIIKRLNEQDEITIDDLSKYYIESNLLYTSDKYVYLPGINFDKRNIRIGISNSSSFMKQFIENLKNGKLTIETCSQVETGPELTKEFIIKQLQDYEKLLDTSILDEDTKEQEEPVKKLVSNKK